MTSTTTTTLQEIKPAAIKPHKLNPRRAVGDVTELAASITQQGVVEPLIVAPNGTGDTWTLIAGHRRLAAAKQAKCKTVPCLVRTDLTDPRAQLELMLVENLQRTDLSPVEEAEAYQQLLEFPGYTQAKIATTTGRAIATVRSRLKMTKLPQSALSKIHAGQISLGHAQALVELAGTKHFREVEAAAGTDRFPYALKRAQDLVKRDRRRDRNLKDLEAAGVPIVERGNGTNSIYGEKAIAEHRSCEGFAAYIEAWSGDIVYICTKPELQEEADAAERADADDQHRQLRARLAEATDARREHLGTVLARDYDAIEGIALDVLRQHVLKRGNTSPEMLGAVLGIDWKDGKARTKRVGELDLAQLAIVVDVAEHYTDERGLEYEHGFGIDGYSDHYKAWRDRLTAVYGYEWSDVERELIELGEAKKADRAAAGVTPDDNDDEDLAPDFDENPDGADE